MHGGRIRRAATMECVSVRRCEKGSTRSPWTWGSSLERVTVHPMVAIAGFSPRGDVARGSCAWSSDGARNLSKALKLVL